MRTISKQVLSEFH